VPPRRRRIFLLGASGTIGRATAQALCARGHEVVCLVRPGAAGRLTGLGAVLREGDATDAASLRRDGMRGERFDAWVSCLASRSGVPADAWAVDHRAHVQALAVLREAGATQAVLLSAICVQKPRLAFQQAKLAFERELMASDLDWSIVRPTAFFKSLSGQVERVRRGGPFLLFGDGRLTACKPISDADLADYLAGCLDEPARQRRVLPIGGPGPAITPREQGELLFRLLGRPAAFRSVPPGLLRVAAAALGAAGSLLPPLAAKAELARIGHYYATESMLVWDAMAGRYDAAATPAHGRDTLEAHYGRLLRGEPADGLGAHKLF
jgi:divinyl chlorophyllide a 8-vinyl-reductase